MKILGVIPARYSSSRLPAKPLKKIGNQSMISWTYHSAKKCSQLDEIVVATDHREIKDEVERFGGKAIMTSISHPSGTDRCLEALKKSEGEYSHVINIQGDEPFIPKAMIQSLIELLKRKEVNIATLAKKIKTLDEIEDPNKVKVVFDKNQKALYFSRSKIPFDRSGQTESVSYYKHIGLYGYSSKALNQICSLKESNLERIESLEQLRWIENGFPIHVGITELESPSIDTQEDLERIRQSL